MQPKDTFFKKKTSLNFNGNLIFPEFPLVMGVLNLTPDSFYDGGKYSNNENIIERIGQMINEGAFIIDIGAVSTRPGASLLSENEELHRLHPVLTEIRKHFPEIYISIDTFRSNVAKEMVENYSVVMINDISAGTLDDKLFDTIAKLNVSYVLMHIQGNPENMQKNPSYKNVTKDVILFLSEKLNQLKLAGVNDIIIDPGFGFGKNLEHNYELLSNLEHFKLFELPILAGLSRKSMIGKLLEIKPTDALNGTTVINTIALQKGADILRVHDVKEAMECIKIYKKLKEVSANKH